MKTYLFILLGLVITLPLAVHGQTNTFAPLNPSLPGIKEFVGSNSIPDLLNNIYKICIGIAAVLAVLQIMRAGVLYMGGDSITEKKEARDLISMSVIGLVLVLAPTIVFSIINPEILNLNIGADKLKVSTFTPTSSVGTNANGQQSCNVYTTKRAVVSSDGSNRCNANEVLAQPICCNLNSPDQICCAQVGATQYLLAGYYTRTRTGEKSCRVLSTSYYASQDVCTSKIPLFAKPPPPPPGTTLSDLVVLKSCVAVTDTSYVVPTDAQNPKCAN
jgi:hypothetical protein